MNKSKLTPCRQMGLSRKRKSLNPSPSPQNLSSNSDNSNRISESSTGNSGNATPVKKHLQIKRKKLSTSNLKPEEVPENSQKNLDIIAPINRQSSIEKWNQHSESEIENEIKNLESILQTKITTLEEEKRKSIYRKKHDLTKLNKLISVWSRGCQEALEALLDTINSKTIGPPITMDKLLQDLNIDKDLVKYSLENESFDS